MKKHTKIPGPVLGYGEKTGVFLKKSDFDQLIEVIAKGKAKDKALKQLGVQQFGGSGKGMIDVPGVGALGIQDFVRKLAKVYGLPDPEGNLYGVNKHGEFIKWVPRDKLGGMN